jgi:hypothetical protein
MERAARRVVVTGLGIVGPLGCDVEESWRRAVAGESGVGPIRSFDPSRLSVRIAAEVKGFDRHDRAVGDAREERGVVEAAVHVDQQSGKFRRDGGRTQRLRDAPRYRQRADVIGDMALELLGVEPQRSVGGGDGVDCVIADEDQPGVAAPGHDLVAVGEVGRDEEERLAHGGVWHAPKYSFAAPRNTPRVCAAP